MSKPHTMPCLKLGSPGDAARRTRAASASVVAINRLKLSKAYAANDQRDERADLLTDAVSGSLWAQLRCMCLFGTKWRVLAADLAIEPVRRENSGI